MRRNLYRDLLLEQDPFTRIAELEAELKEAHEQVELLKHDCVSGLLGRQAFEDLLEAVFVPRRADDGLMGILMCDIDNFKSINDEFGHRVGDDVIANVAKAVKSCCRSIDHVARYGGEEFVVIVGRAELEGLTLFAERIRSTVERLTATSVPKTVTISVGFAIQEEADEDPWDIVGRADHALGLCKEGGRNQVAFCDLKRAGEKVNESRRLQSRTG